MNEDLIAALVAERYGANQWWTRKRPEPKPVDEVAGRRRLAECVADAERTEQSERTA
jgi:hypothetical protein